MKEGNVLCVSFRFLCVVLGTGCKALFKPKTVSVSMQIKLLMSNEMQSTRRAERLPVLLACQCTIRLLLYFSSTYLFSKQIFATHAKSCRAISCLGHRRRDPQTHEVTLDQILSFQSELFT